MSKILPILILLSLQAIVDARKVTFAKIKGRVFVETDDFHYGMFGQITDAEGIRIVVVNGEDQFQQTAKCRTDRTELKELTPEYVKSYREIRENYLQEAKRERGRWEAIDTGNKYWTADISYDHEKYMAAKIDVGVIAYSSKYFPEKLSMVIIDGDLIIFLHNDGNITMKTVNCLFKNEKIVVDGIKKMKIGHHLIPRMTPIRDDTLRSYLKKHPIDFNQFYREQMYIPPNNQAKKSWTKFLLPRFDRSVFF